MRKHELLENDVDLKELAALTKNYSGAEIAGLIKSASSFAFNRHVKVIYSFLMCVYTHLFLYMNVDWKSSFNYS